LQLLVKHRRETAGYWGVCPYAAEARDGGEEDEALQEMAREEQSWSSVDRYAPIMAAFLTRFKVYSRRLTAEMTPRLAQDLPQRTPISTSAGWRNVPD
jgi:hypothetical protein